MQKSVFEAQLTKTQIAKMTKSVERLMNSERFYSKDDNVRVCRIAGNCEGAVFGAYTKNLLEENIVL